MAAQGRVQQSGLIISAGLAQTVTLYTVSAGAVLYLDYFMTVASAAYPAGVQVQLLIDGAGNPYAVGGVVSPAIYLQLTKPLLCAVEVQLKIIAGFNGNIWWALAGDEV